MNKPAWQGGFKRKELFMDQGIVQPSSDARATALAIAARLYAYADFDKAGNKAADKEALANSRLKLIVDAAKQLYDAVKG